MTRQNPRIRELMAHLSERGELTGDVIRKVRSHYERIRRIDAVRVAKVEVIR